MRDVLVVQWSRLGDVIQTRPLLSSLKSLGYSTTLCLDERYRDLQDAIPEADRFLPVPLSALSAQARHSGSHPELIRWLRGLAETAEVKRFDRSIVLTPSLAAVAATEIFDASVMDGYRRSSGKLETPAPMLDLAARLLDGLPAVHVADVWRIIGGGPLAVENRCARPFDPTLIRIAIIADAADATRAIPREIVATICGHLACTLPCNITLLGTNPSDPAIALTSIGAVRDLCGQTGLRELVATLNECNIVIGPDTGSLHLASALGCRCIGLYRYPAIAQCTSPYQANSYVGQVRDWSAGLAQDVERIIRLLTNGDADSSALSKSAHWWRTGFDTFGLNLDPVGHGDLNSNERGQTRTKFFRRHSTSTSDVSQDPNPPLDGLSIIIPELGGHHYTDALRCDLRDLEGRIPHEVIVISSGDNARSRLPGTTVCERTIVNRANLSFAVASNMGASAARFLWLLFLNNDTRTTAADILRLFAERKNMSLTAPVIVYPDGVIQNAGVSFENGNVTEIGNGQAALNGSESKPNALSGAAILVDKQRFLALHGFDEAYVNGYEDIDLCLRAKAAGIEIKVVPSARIVHFRGSNSLRFNNEDANRSRFLSRWNNSAVEQEAQHQGHTKVTAGIDLFLSDESEFAAGSLTRWIWPSRELDGGGSPELTWLQTRQFSQAAIQSAIVKTKKLTVFRPLNDVELSDWIASRANAGSLVLHVDCDDLILGRFRPDSPRGVARREYELAFLRLLQAAESVTVSTDEIKAAFVTHGIQAEVRETEPFSFAEQLQCGLKKETGEIRIGFAGSPAHTADLAIVLPALEHILERHECVRFYWWGCRPGELSYHSQVRQAGPIVDDYITHLSRLAGFDLDFVLVPLLDTPANRARTPLKFYESQVIGVPGIYSNVKPYNLYVEDRVTGLLVRDSTGAWIEAMEQLIDARPLRHTILERARHAVRNRLVKRRGSEVNRESCAAYSSMQFGVAS